MDSPIGNAIPLQEGSGPGQKKQTTVIGTSAVEIVPAYVGNVNPRISGTHVDIVGLIITSTNTAPATLTIADGAGNQFTWNWAGTGPTFPTLQLGGTILQHQANSAWTLTASANANGFTITVFYQLREAYESAY